LASSPVCTVGFKKENLENKDHVVVVKSLGVSAQAPVGNAASLDFEGLMCVYSLPSMYHSMPDGVFPL
jgi:hypothetical protein